ncbi:hypothetical protein WJX72_008785 [[Myrmecia] bisecta]|uniref:Uncharacterized protein n=1 Tax=[Myrmecia] bisecta TaxID=41462 RepID=A0AAW1P8V6_9CHLO
MPGISREHLDSPRVTPKQPELAEAKKATKDVDAQLQALKNRLAFLAAEEAKAAKLILRARQRTEATLTQRAQQHTDQRIAQTAAEALQTLRKQEPVRRQGGTAHHCSTHTPESRSEKSKDVLMHELKDVQFPADRLWVPIKNVGDSSDAHKLKEEAETAGMAVRVNEFRIGAFIKKHSEVVSGAVQAPVPGMKAYSSRVLAQALIEQVIRVGGKGKVVRVTPEVLDQYPGPV